MTRTKRIYNKPWNITHLYTQDTFVDAFFGGGPGCYHPYKQLCMGNCPSCRWRKYQNPHKFKLRRLENEKRLRLELCNLL
jgi:hypothetical protein